MARKVWVPTVSGPLAPYAAGFASWLASRAYSPWAAADRLYQFDQLSRWLERGELGVGELTGEQAERFAAARRAAGVGVVGVAAERRVAAGVSAATGSGTDAGTGFSGVPTGGAACRLSSVSVNRARALRSHGTGCVWACRALVPL